MVQKINVDTNFLVSFCCNDLEREITVGSIMATVSSSVSPEGTGFYYVEVTCPSLHYNGRLKFCPFCGKELINLEIVPAVSANKEKDPLQGKGKGFIIEIQNTDGVHQVGTIKNEKGEIVHMWSGYEETERMKKLVDKKNKEK